MPTPTASADASAPRGETGFERLVDVMARLRAPDGCPWDREQSHESLIRYLIEETYEVVDAIESGDRGLLCEELGDLMLQVVFHSQLAAEDGHFDVQDACDAIVEKLVRRHPHVFGDDVAETAQDVENRWERIKAAEKRERGDDSGILSGIPRHLPGLLKAQRLTEKAGKLGFDWPDAQGVLAKLKEELGELEAEVTKGDIEGAREEFGDLLFVLANLARHLDVDAETALQAANAKFVRRFSAIEELLRQQGRSAVDAPLAELDELWNRVKREERSGSD